MSGLSILDSLGSRASLIVLQSSAAQSSLPLLDWAVNQNSTRSTVLLCCLLYPPQALVNAISKVENLVLVNCSGGIPGYGNSGTCNHREVIIEAIDAAPEGDLAIVIDSVETLASDLDSSSKAVIFLSKLLSLVQARSPSSQLILHMTGLYNDKYGDILPRISGTQFSMALLHVVPHPPILLRHLSEVYSTPPPPMSPSEKFWSVFTPFVTRGPGIEAEALVFGTNGDGTSSSEMVLEVLYRGPNESSGTSRKLTRGVERSVEGWKDGSLCAMSTLPSLSSVFKRKAPITEHTPKQTQDLSFNLNLTSEQQQKRAEVPLPYEHTGLSASGVTSSTILYDPDSADDIDDDDPDEDLDI